MSPQTIYWPDRSPLKCGVPLTEEGWMVKCECGFESEAYEQRGEALVRRSTHLKEEHGQAGYKNYRRRGF